MIIQRATTTPETGFTLLEVVLALVLMGMVLVGVSGMYHAIIRSSGRSRDLSIAVNLAQGLMEEIKGKAFEEPDDDPDFGPEIAGTPAEPAVDTATDRTLYDDVDDYNGWTRTPPENILGAAMDGSGVMPDYTAFTRSVIVEYVSESDFDSPDPGPTDAKKIAVTVSWGTESVELKTVVADYSD